MTAYHGHLLNATTLILMGGWGYFSTNSPREFLPILFGVVLLSISTGVQNKVKGATNVAFIFTILALGTIASEQLIRTMSSTDLSKKIRVISEIATASFAIILFLKQFILSSKRKRQINNQLKP